MIGGLRQVLAAQIERLSESERRLLSWLAVEREPVSFADLAAELGPRIGRGATLEAIENLRRRSPFRVDEFLVLFDEERLPHRDHHENAEQTAEDGDGHHSRKFEVESDEQERRHGDADAECDRLAGRTRRLHDVVFENRRTAERKQPEQRDRKHGDGNGAPQHDDPDLAHDDMPPNAHGPPAAVGQYACGPAAGKRTCYEQVLLITILVYGNSATARPPLPGAHLTGQGRSLTSTG